MKEKSYIQMVLAELGITSYEDYIEKIKIWESFDNRVSTNISDITQSHLHQMA